jgi:hypothetical protein
MKPDAFIRHTITASLRPRSPKIATGTTKFAEGSSWFRNGNRLWMMTWRCRAPGKNILQDLLNQAVGPVHFRNAGKPVNRFSFSFGRNFLSSAFVDKQGIFYPAEPN